jgi:hypothetical protein
MRSGGRERFGQSVAITTEQSTNYFKVMMVELKVQKVRKWGHVERVLW